MANVSTLAQEAAKDKSAGRPPRLESGDHLDQPTFHARYEAMPENFTAELIGGIVYVASPLLTPHGDYHALTMHWLGEYRMHTPGTSVLDNATAILDFDSEPQPDAALLIDPTRGGQAQIDKKGWLIGPPELVVEIASSSEAYDLHEKRLDYEKAGVLEYVVVLIRDQSVRWFVLHDGNFEDHAMASDGIFRSSVMPGLWLDAPALHARDSRKMIETLRQGLATPEHTAFVKRLKRV